MKPSVIFVIWCLHGSFAQCSKADDTLKLVHMVFRHGDRTPVPIPMVKHLYVEEKYYPYGFGQLTNRGKQRAYNLGKWLRHRYDSFLNNTFTLKEISAVSTNTGRSKSSLALVLAGLYPPKGTLLEWNKGLNWNPINYQVLPTAHPLLPLPTPDCNRFMELFQIYSRSNAGQKMLKKYNPIKKYLSHYTNITLNSTLAYFTIYDIFIVQKEFGLTLPMWMNEVLPMLHKNSPNDFGKASLATKDMKQVVIGHLIKKIINDTTSKLSKSKKFKNKKLFMYSSHDFNVAAMLLLMNPSFSFKRPPYSACVILEIHTINNVNGIKVFYQPNVNTRPRSVPIHRCGVFCPIDKFIKIYKEYYPVIDHC